MIGIQLVLSRETDTLLKMVDVLQIDSFQFFLDGNSQSLQRQKGYELRSVLTTSKKTFGVKKIFVHAPYNIYIGSKTRSKRISLWKKIKEKLKFCEDLNLDGLIVHAYIPIKTDINEIIDEANDLLFDFVTKVPLLLENVSVKDKIGSNMEKFEQFIKNMKTIIPVGVCLDTAHLFEAGYHFETKPIAQELSKKYPAVFKESILIHLNDSKTSCGSFIDQHEELGKGAIGLGALGAIVSLFSNETTFITEPPIDNLDNYISNVDILRGLVKANIKTKVESID